MKPWGGRFAKETDRLMEEFHASVHFDHRLLPYDVQGSKAHARMLAHCGIISREEAELICRGLDEVLADLEAGRAELLPEFEDVHMNVERLLVERIGEVGKKLHTARSRNDQVALDTRMYLKDALRRVEDGIIELERALIDKAEEHLDVAMPGYTHLQRAQPVLFAHHLLAYVEMFERDRERLADCYRRTDVCPLGSGALAGVTFPIDREFVRRELGFARLSRNSMDAVSDRDFVIEFLSAASLLMVHLSRLSEELVLWSSQEFGFVELDDAYTTGSSMMPQKKNPDVPELVRGKTGRVIGDLVAVLTVMKGLPLTYNKDMQEDKEALFDAVDTVTGCLALMAPVIRTMKVRADVMMAALRHGHLSATDLADYLVRRGVPFRSAHEMVGRAVRRCLERGVDVSELGPEELKELGIDVGDDIRSVLSVQGMLERRAAPGGTAPAAVRERLEEARRLVATPYVPRAGTA